MQTILLIMRYTGPHNKIGSSVVLVNLFHATANLTGAIIHYWVTDAGLWLSLIQALPVVALEWGKFFRCTSLER